MEYEHLLPEKEYYHVYFTDNYTIYTKKFSALEYAQPYVNLLVNSPGLFRFIEMRKVTEKTI